MKPKFKIILLIACLNFSCKKFIEINPPKSSLIQETVFQNNDQAVSAIAGIYATMATSGYASGSSSSITCVAGLSSDELIGYSNSNIPFYENQLTPDNSILEPLYTTSYKSIYTANAVLEGLASPNGVTAPIKTQLEGEALFIRAFTYFYLVNLYGPVPLQLSTDYRISKVASRAPVSVIYSQIIADLGAAENLLTDTYITAGRVRPNRSAVQALLARTYLYLEDWKNAEKYASIIIAKNQTYNLVNIDAIFLANSQETIWQLMPNANTNSQEGNLFILTTTPTIVSLKNSIALNIFEQNDKRQTAWVRSISVGANTYYYPYKYKIRSSSTVTEYSMILRLAEQYLIRAEARINQGKIDVGIEDLNLVRNRPLPNIGNSNPIPRLSSTLNKTDALLAVERERRVEFLCEWGHRWFDLKRTGRVNDVLGPIKNLWKSTDTLYPIPMNEISRNLSIIQNDGY